MKPYLHPALACGYDNGLYAEWGGLIYPSVEKAKLGKKTT